MAIPISCPMCNADNNYQFVVTHHVYGDLENRHAFYHCDKCDVRYLYPRLSPEQERKFYEMEFEKFMDRRAGPKGGWENVKSHYKANEPNRIRRMSYLNPYLQEHSRILEVGCSSGFMLKPLLDQGHECHGVDPSNKFRDYLDSVKIHNYSSMDELEAAKESEGFDIIMHFFVLEHISNPLNFLEQQIKMLKAGGKIVFEIPNVSDPLYAIYDIPEFERFYWSIAHPWYFSVKSLDYLLKKLNFPFSIELDQRYDLSNHLIWARDGKPGGMERFTQKLGADLELNYKKNLIKTGYCDTLIGIISKP